MKVIKSLNCKGACITHWESWVCHLLCSQVTVDSIFFIIDFSSFSTTSCRESYETVWSSFLKKSSHPWMSLKSVWLLFFQMLRKPHVRGKVATFHFPNPGRVSEGGAPNRRGSGVSPLETRGILHEIGGFFCNCCQLFVGPRTFVTAIKIEPICQLQWRQVYYTRPIITTVIIIFFRHFDFTLKSGTFGVLGLVLPGRKTAWHKYGMATRVRGLFCWFTVCKRNVMPLQSWHNIIMSRDVISISNNGCNYSAYNTVMCTPVIAINNKNEFHSNPEKWTKTVVQDDSITYQVSDKFVGTRSDTDGHYLYTLRNGISWTGSK